MTYPFRRILFIYINWWIFWALGQSLVLHRAGISWEVALIDATVSSTLLAILCFTAITLYHFYQPGTNKGFYRFVYAFGIAALYCIVLKWSLSLFIPMERGYQFFLEKSMPVRFIISLLVLLFVTLLNWMWHVLQDQNREEERRNEARQLMKEAELIRLRQQLQPHFLFNSLNSISALAGARPDEARKMIQQLSDFLRGTLRKDEQQMVSLGEELDHLSLYLSIEKVRFGHRLNVTIDFQEEALQNRVPALLLQPIVENAIKFGLYGTCDQIEVSLLGQTDQAYLNIEVRNPFDAMTQDAGGGTGFGLSSIQRRLFLLYGRNDLLGTETREGLFITRLKIPLSQTQT
jgi:two-component system LytT family sensor kinase